MPTLFSKAGQRELKSEFLVCNKKESTVNRQNHKNSNLNFDLNINIFVVVNLRTAKFFSTVDCADRKSANTTRRKHGEISQR